MGIRSYLSGLFGGAATKQQRGEQTGAPSSYSVKSPKTVTEDTALQVSAVWACVKLLSETVAALPLTVKNVDGERRSKDDKSTLSSILTKTPNARQTPIEFRETMMLNLSLHGNAYAMKQRNGGGDVIGLWPLPAQQMKVELMDDGSVVYMLHKTVAGQLDMTAIAAENMLHIKLFGNGVIGLSPLAHARTSIGLELAAEEFASSYYTNAGKPGGILTIDQILTPTQRELLKEKFADLIEGTDNMHKLQVLEAGMKYQQVQLNPEDMQMMETRRFNLEDIARFWGIPSILINDNKDTTSWGSGIEQIIIGWLNTGLGPMLTRWEQSLESALIPSKDRGAVEIRFDIADLLRADTKGRGEFLRSMVSVGLMTRNEGRIKLNLEPVEGGDALTAQINQAPIEQLSIIGSGE
ncbi:phage portal protein [uncultured Paraglaciecola sp.]|uniref:phage portal protein n=1 Tax=uncultured Paraglaciecola sp. TaxID=1765024 RepID=UPI002629D694|nr:phage portal protein [uncultured Paraglaciecola sp.]